MRFLVTCGPTYESLDKVRRLTNFSTGKLGTELGNFLTDQGHDVTVLQGYYTTYRNPCRAKTVIQFTTTANLLEQLQSAARNSESPFGAVFHAAAVSDFAFGKIFRREANGHLAEVTSGKFGTRDGALLAELIPTPKIISQLRTLFPQAKIFGWKYEVEGNRKSVCALGLEQLSENNTDYCVVNGPAYGEGFGVLGRDKEVSHYPGPEQLFRRLLDLISKN